MQNRSIGSVNIHVIDQRGNEERLAKRVHRLTLGERVPMKINTGTGRRTVIGFENASAENSGTRTAC